MEVQAGQLPSRRDRVRAATRAEILQTARKVLLTEGSGAISLRAIAREMGMTAPAIYRYFDSHEDLINNVAGELFNELTDYVLAATGAVATDPEAISASPGVAAATLLAEQLIAACHAFREWALAHRPEFGLIFATPLPALGLPLDDPCMLCGLRFGDAFLGIFARLYRIRPFPVPADGEIDPSLRAQLARFRELAAGPALPASAAIDGALPLGALLTFLRCWVQLYGSVCLEVFGQLQFALNDPAPMFELVLADLAARVGFSYPFHRPAA